MKFKRPIRTLTLLKEINGYLKYDFIISEVEIKNPELFIRWKRR